MPIKTNTYRITIPIITALILFSCGFFRSPDREPCNKILPAEKITDILTDIYLMEGYLSNRQNTFQRTRDSVDFFLAEVFEKHKITYEEFKKALDCYLLHPKDMEMIHEEILSRLSILMSEADAAQELLYREQQRAREAALERDTP